MARKGCGPYNLGAPKSMAKQLGPQTEKEASRTRIDGPIVNKAMDYVNRKDAEQKAARASLITRTDQDGRTYNQISYKGQSFNVPTEKEYKKLKKMQQEGRFDNYKDYDDYNKKHTYNYNANLLEIQDGETGDKKVKQKFSRGQSRQGTSGGGTQTDESARRLNIKGQQNVRTIAESFQNNPATRNPNRFKDYKAAQEVLAGFKTDSLASDHSAQDYVRREKAKIKAYEGTLGSSPNNKVKSSAFKMKGYGSKSYK